MCGIGVLLGQAASDAAVDDMVSSLKKRGPDNHGVYKLEEEATFVASVLHIQGTELCQQPYVDEAGNVLLWNGEVFGVDVDNPFLRMPAVESSDTECISQMFSSAFSVGSRSCIAQEAATALSCIHGPYAFVYYHCATRTILFGRDPFGRRSLLVLRREETIAAVSSVATTLTLPAALDFQAANAAWQEVSVGGIHQVVLGERKMIFTPWPSSRLRLLRTMTLPVAPALPAPSSSSEKFLVLLQLAISKRLERLAGARSVGVLFSGGIDSMLMAALLHRCVESRPSLPIELINVTFLGETTAPSPDRLAGIAGMLELQTLYPSRPWKLVHVDVDSAERARYTNQISLLVQPRDTHMDLNIGTAFFFAARGLGYLRNYPSNAEAAAMGAESLGRPLLRFGGRGAPKGVEWSAATTKAEKVHSPCSQSLCGRWRKEGCVCDCCSKCCLAMQRQGNGANACSVHKMRSADVSIFSVTVEGSGPINPEEETEMFASHCKVLLVGIGADEQMAGYGRHRTTFLIGGVDALERELSLDMERLWERNLGRDDRVISDSGREPWFPYLDEGVVKFLQELPIESLADLTLPPGIGDKKILREAASILGLRSNLVKRAVQFGSHIAKATNFDQRKSNRSSKGTMKTKTGAGALVE